MRGTIRFKRLVREAYATELRVLRMSAGLSQREVGEALGIARPIVARQESGRHSASLAQACRNAWARGGTLLDVLAAVDARLSQRAA